MGTPALYIDLLDDRKNSTGILLSVDYLGRNLEVRFNIFRSPDECRCICFSPMIIQISSLN
jgi:hypothetical protein